MRPQQPSGVRGRPSLDEDLHRLRPNGYQSNDTAGADRPSAQQLSPHRRDPLRPVAVASASPRSNSPAPSNIGGEDGLSRPISATSMTSEMPMETTRVTKFRRRVQIQSGDDHSDVEGAAGGGHCSRPSPLRLPGQPLSSTQQHGTTRNPSNLTSPSTVGAPWMSFTRANSAHHFNQLPPEGLPPLHSAAWFNDLDTLLELLKTTAEPLANLIWVNRKLYPQDGSAAAATGTEPRGRGPTIARPPETASMATATRALKALLHREYLHHACHPLTIAAAHGNERIVDELLKAMLEEAQADKIEMTVTWRSPPEELPPGCPWVTPLAAAALGGNGECVRLLAMVIARRKSLSEDRSTYGCFRFRALTVAQTADVVHNLFKYGCCHPDTIRYSLCDAARRIAKLDCGCVARNSQATLQTAPQPRPPRRPNSGGPDGADDESNSPPESPRNASQASISRRPDSTAGSFADAQQGGGGGGSSFLHAAASMDLQGQLTTAPGDPRSSMASTATKAAELMLFRARLFHDSLGRPLSQALCEFQAETLAAVAALSGMVEHGLQPDRFLSHAEHRNLTSTSLLMVLVRNYRSALQAAAGGSGGGGGPGGALSSLPTASGVFSESAAASTGAGASAASMTQSGIRGAQALLPGTDFVSAAQEVLSSLVAGLLAHGAVVDDPPREGCRQVGGFHMAPPHGPEAPLHHAFIHGPQELVLLLLQYSGLQPEVHEDLVARLAGDGADGGSNPQYHAAKARAFYSRGPQGQQKRGKGQVPWEGGRSSPLLAFGAKMQSALVEGTLPLWLHSGRFSELMEDLIKCTIATDAYMLTSDLTWLIVELFERCMAHEFDNLPQLRAIYAQQGEPSEDRGAGGPDSGLAPAGSTVITVDSEVVAPVPVKAAAKKPSDSGAPEVTSPATRRKAARRKSVVFSASAGVDTGAAGGGSGRSRADPPGFQGPSGQPADGKKNANATGADTDDGGEQDEQDEAELSDSESAASSSDASGSVEAVPTLRRTDKLTASTLVSTGEDSITLSIVCSLYRNTADAITGLHQALTEGGSLDGPLASMVGSGGAVPPAAMVTIASNAVALVDWTALLRLVARIAATTLNPPKAHGSAAAQISVFTTAKAVNQLLYARDWAREDSSGAGSGPGGGGGAGGGGGGYPSSVIDIDLLRAIARRHPHEAARLIHGLDLMRVELKGYRWDSIPMSLGQDFYAVFCKGEAVKLSNKVPTVAAASVAAAAEAAQRQVELVSGRLKRKSSAAVFPAGPDGAAAGADTGAGEGYPAGDLEPEALTREDLLQACIFSNMWSVLTHYLLSSTRLPSYMQSLQILRNRTYKYAVLGQVFQYGSIPVVIGVGVILALLGLLSRGLQRTVGLAGNLVLALYGRLEERLQPAMSHMGRKLQLHRVQRRVGRMVRRVDQLALRATGGSVISGSAARMTVRIIPQYLSFLGVLLDPDALAEVWLGVTQHYSRGRARKFKNEGGGGGDGGGPAYLSWRTTRVVCNRVPLSCAAAMPASLLYKLASSPQVNAELFAAPVMRAVITWRWQHYTRYFLLQQFLEHLIYMAFFMVYAFSLSYSQDTFTQLLGEARTMVVAREGCTLPPSGFQKFLLISLGVMTLTCVVQEFRQLLFFKLDWFRQPWNLMDFASSCIVGTIITLHVNCPTDAELLRGLAAVEVTLLFMRLLYFAMADDRLGSFFRMVIEVLRDCWLFFVFLGILFVGWGLALAVLQGQRDDQKSSVQDTYLQLFTMIFGDFSMTMLQSVDAGSPGLNQLWRMFASIYQIMVTIILLNLLIAIINDSYERINDNEACESLRNKLTLIVEAESVLPAGMARRMLESLAQADLYVITAEAATVTTSTSTTEEDATAPDSGAARGPRRTLSAPARWSGRMGETKRFIGNIVDQLTTQQLHFQTRVITMLSGIANLKGAGDALPGAAVGLPSAGREGPRLATGRGGKAPAARFSGVGAGAVGVGAGGMRGIGAAPTAVTQGSLIDMGDAEAFAEVIDLGKLLRDKLSDLKQQNEETQQRQEEALAGMARHLREAMERVGRDVARAAADSAATAVVATSAVRLGGGEKPGSRGQPDGAGSGVAASPGWSGGGRSDLVVVERSALEGIAQRAAEQAAQMAVQAVLRELGRTQ